MFPAPVQTLVDELEPAEAMNGIALHAQPLSTAIEPTPAADRLQQILVPTLGLWGNLDFPHLQARSHNLTAQLPQVRCEVLQGTAHLPKLEQPKRFSRALLAFCESLPPCMGH